VGAGNRTTILSSAAKSAVVAGETDTRATVDSLAADGDGAPTTVKDAPGIGEADPEAPSASDPFDPTAIARIVVLWILTPTIAATAAYLAFRFLPALP